MQLDNGIDSQNLLNRVIHLYYEKEKRSVRNFLSGTSDTGGYFICYLIDRKHVMRYSIGSDRGTWLAAVEIGIGPHYFGVAAFWSYEHSCRFSMDATTEGVEENLALLDEYWAEESNKP